MRSTKPHVGFVHLAGWLWAHAIRSISLDFRSHEERELGFKRAKLLLR
jgi:hypothetical protein